MAPGTHGVVHTAQAWLQSSWHIQVPFAWLEACIQWLQEEGGGEGRLSQQHINQQVLDQWLLTDLRDLGHAVLPNGLSQAQKTELSGIFCVQVDSLLDISQPAYGQLQKWKGTDCTNEEVSAVTQATQRPWEARPTRMLLLQVTDGVQSLEAMEYQPIPALNTALRPGVKLQLEGQMVCRLGVLLLGPTNVKVLGGEVEDMVERNKQIRVLHRALGLPEVEQQGGEEVPPAPHQGNQEIEDVELDDQELLASLEAQDELERVQGRPSLESGYGTLGQASTQSSRSSSVRSHVFITSSSVTDHNMADEDFPDEDFDDLPLDELDSVIFQESTNVTPQSDSSHRSCDKTVLTPPLTSPPFTYLCLLEGLISKSHSRTTEVRVKAFIVTLLGKLTSNNGVWKVCATISDGTGYLDVELSDDVLTGLLGFSVAEKGILKRDPTRRGELDAGMKRCQEELVDMCCVMTIVVEPQGRKAVVIKVDPVTEHMLRILEKRVWDRRACRMIGGEGGSSQ
ncbi:recQ-mediated genome instability protein 1 [Diretmus argenteus]